MKTVCIAGFLLHTDMCLLHTVVILGANI